MRLLRAFKNNGRGIIVAGDDWCVVLMLLDESISLLSVGLAFGFGASIGVAGALLAAGMLTRGAYIASAETRMAKMAFLVNAHADGFVDAEHISFGSMPLTRLDFQPEPSAQLLCTFLVHLDPRYPRGAFIFWYLPRLGSRSRLA